MHMLNCHAVLLPSGEQRLVATLALGPLAGRRLMDFPCFAERLFGALPAYARSACRLGGGQLRGGSSLAEVAARLAVALQSPAAPMDAIAEVRELSGAGGRVALTIGCVDTRAGRIALAQALRLVGQLATGAPMRLAA